jgi:RHS repeat-associated protein
MSRANSTISSIRSTLSYYPFGMPMPGRSYTGESYRFGFNGMENANDIAPGNYTTEFRELDTRLGGRWWSTDPIVKPWESPYAGFSNNPIYFADPSGLDPEDSNGGGNSSGEGGGDGGENDIAAYVNIPEVEITANSTNIPSYEISSGDVNLGDMAGNAYKGTLNEYNKEFGTNYKTHQEAKNDWHRNNYPSTYDPNWLPEAHQAIGYGLWVIEMQLMIVSFSSAGFARIPRVPRVPTSIGGLASKVPQLTHATDEVIYVTTQIPRVKANQVHIITGASQGGGTFANGARTTLQFSKGAKQSYSSINVLSNPSLLEYFPATLQNVPKVTKWAVGTGFAAALIQSLFDKKNKTSGDESTNK